MSDVTYFGAEETQCDDPYGVGCTHILAIHGHITAGCSHIGSSGWCLCRYKPNRTGAAALLEASIAAGFDTSAALKKATGPR